MGFGESAISDSSSINSANVYRPVRQALGKASALYGAPVTCRRRTAEWALMLDVDFGDKGFKGRIQGAESEVARVSG